MLNILMPTQVSSQKLAAKSLYMAAVHANVPFKVIVVADGGQRKDYAELDEDLASSPYEWQMIHSERQTGFNRCIQAGAEFCRNPFVVVMRPNVSILDPKWLQKMMMVMTRDHNCMIVDAVESATKSTTVPPVKRTRKNLPSENCELAMLRTSYARKELILNDSPYFTEMARRSIHGGGTAWAAPGILYTVEPAKEHKAWVAPSVEKVARSGS